MEGIWMKISIVFAVSGIYLHYNRDTFHEEQIMNQNVLVTGASSGVGEQIAYHYARMGANVFITARREHLLTQVVDRCKEIGRSDAVFGYVVADMLHYEQTSKLVIQEAVKALGALDHVILNHAMLPASSLWRGNDSDLMQMKRFIEVNYLSFVHLASAAIPYLKQSGNAHLGVVSSLAGKLEVMGSSSYSASKFALDGFFSSLRLDLQASKSPISVTLCPLGMIGTENGRKSFEGMIQSLQLDSEKFLGYNTIASASDTALAIVQGVTRGDREVYHPPLMGVQNDAKLLPVLRHLAPWLLSLDMAIFK